MFHVLYQRLLTAFSVRPGNICAILTHLLPNSACTCTIIFSSSSDHATFEEEEEEEEEEEDQEDEEDEEYAEEGREESSGLDEANSFVALLLISKLRLSESSPSTFTIATSFIWFNNVSFSSNASPSS